MNEDLTLGDVKLTGDKPVIDITPLTEGKLNGDGVFDKLMQLTKAHLQEEFKANRITGKEYSTVYLGALQAVLQQSIAYLSKEDQHDEIEARVGLIRQQTVTELAKTDDLIPDGLGFNDSTAVEGLTAQEVLLNAQKILLATAEVDKSTAEKGLINQKIVTELAQTDNAIPNGLGYNDSTAVEGTVELQKLKLTSEDDLLKQKVLTEVANTSATLPDDAPSYGKNPTTTLGGLVKTQIDKVSSEVQLLNQKAVTELAQTDDYIPAGTGISTNTAVTGVVGKQKGLFTAQTDGFARDAEQKLAKIMVDTFTAQLASDSGTPLPSNLDNPSLDAVLSKAKTGIGVA